ncbi:MAG: SAM hydroxide adenosyltransferase, partial [Solirubrobacterales bacterium]
AQGGSMSATTTGGGVLRATIEIAGFDHRATRGRAFGDVPAGGLLLYVDSSGRAALAVNRGSAAAELGLEPGDEVVIRLD